MAIIYSYPKKSNPTSKDLVLITDHEDNKTKNATISSIQELVNGVSSVNGLAGTVLLDAASSNLVRTTNTGTNTISYDLASNPTIAGTLTAAGLKPSGGSSPTAITHFETGVWTPQLEYYNTSTTTWTNISTLSDFAYDNQNGFYTRINNIVTLNVKIRINNTSGSAVDCGGIRIVSLPFTPNTTYGGGGSLSIFTYSLGNGSSNMIPYPNANGIELNYLTIKNPDTTYFGGAAEVAATGGSNVNVPLATPSSYQGSQVYLNTSGNTSNKTRLATGVTQWWGTINYYIVS